MSEPEPKPGLSKKKSLARIAKHRSSTNSLVSQNLSETADMVLESDCSDSMTPFINGLDQPGDVVRSNGHLAKLERSNCDNGSYSQVPDAGFKSTNGFVALESNVVVASTSAQQHRDDNDLSFLVNKNCKFYESSIDDLSYSNKSTEPLASSDDQSESATSLVSGSSFLPSITTFDARKRSYLAGCVSGHQSLLGINELSRYFPERKVCIFIGTWNMNGKTPCNLDDFLLPNDVIYLPDIYAISTQESLVDKREWEVKIQTTIGPSHVLFHSAVIGVLYLMIFMRRDLVWFCSIPEQSYLTTRPITSIKTKGAIAIGFIFFGTSLLFIASHLSAHDYNLKERELEYQKIKNNLDLPKVLTTKTQYFRKDVTARYDCVFWSGDLNYRLTAERSVIIKMLNDPGKDASKKLMHGDQLTNEMKIGKVFHGFNEAPIQFRPTYKYNVNSDDFDSSQKVRTPAFTDRILYRCRRRNSVSCLLYNSAPSMKTSDHKPVYGLYDVMVRPGTDNIPLSAGLFNRDVYLEAIRQRSIHLVLDKSDRSGICSVM